MNWRTPTTHGPSVHAVAGLRGPNAMAGLRGPNAMEGELRISAVTGAGVPELLHRLAGLVTQARDARPPAQAFVVHRPEPEGVRIERADDGALVVRGASAERAVALSDLTDQGALAYVHERLRRLGVDRALARSGAREGDTVRIGDLSFEYRAGGNEHEGRAPRDRRRR